LLIVSIGSEYPCDFSWAKIADMSVYRLTFTPDMVRKLVEFKSGSFEDLERAVEKYFGVNFGWDYLERRYRWSVWGVERYNHRLVSQKVGTIASVDGETLWFFSGKPEYEKIDLFKVADICDWDINQAVEQEKIIIKSQRDVDLTLSYQGAIRLELTKNAPKGVLGTSGSFAKSLEEAVTGEMKDAVNKMIEADEAVKEEVKKAMEQLEQLPQMPQMPNFTF
jgi:hypothetical protein